MRRARLLLALVAVGTLALALTASASGYYSAKGAGVGTGPVGALTVPTITAATPAAGGTVTLTWKGSTVPSGAVSYSVTRNGGAPAGNCPTTSEPESEITTCTDEGLEPGTYVYQVTAKYRTWTAVGGTSSAKVLVGPTDHFTMTAASTTPNAGATDSLTITAKDKAGATVTTYAGEHELTFEGAEAIGTNKPSVVDNTSTAVAFGAVAKIKFTAGIATVASSKNGVLKLYKAGPTTISVGDGTIETEPALALTVAPLAMSKLVLTAATVTPTAGVEDALTTTALDTYGNVATAYTGSHSLKYSGPVASPGGQTPNVTDSTGNEIAIGTLTPTVFTKGVATVSEGNNGALTLYKAAAASVKVTEGSISSAALTITAAAGPAASLKLAAATTTPVAAASDSLTTTALDAYGNTATSYAGTRNLTFSGPEASPNGTAASVSNSSGAAINVGTVTPLTFTAGVATVSSTKNGVFKAAKAGATTLSATDGSISTTSALALTVTAGTAVDFAWSAPTISAGTLSSPCLFTCAVTKLGNGGTFTAKVAVTDALGNVVSNVGTARTLTVTATAGSTVTGGSLTIASTGLAESTATFTYKSKASGTFTDTITATKSGSSTYANATATTSN